MLYGHDTIELDTNQPMIRSRAKCHSTINISGVNFEENADENIRRAKSYRGEGDFNSAMNHLPSRQVAYLCTMRNIRNVINTDIEEDYDDAVRVQRIVKQIEQNADLMQDTPDGEALRTETVRDIPQNLTIKRNVKAKLTASVSVKSKGRRIGFLKRLKYGFTFRWNNLKQDMKSILFNLQLWYNNIKNIEGHFGSGVATYFHFMRWLFLMNTFIVLLLLSFIVIPQELYNSYIDPINNTSPFSVADIFTGQGYFTNTTLYYGFYTTNTFSVITDYYYNVPNAYLFTMLFIYIAIFIYVSLSMAKSYRTNFIKTTGGLKNIYASKIFCGWDFSIATREAATLKSKTIYNEIKELIADDNSVTEETLCSKKFYLICIRLAINLFILTLFGITGVIMWTLMDDKIHDSAIANSHKKSVLMASVVTVIMFFFPMLFAYLIKFERYSNPRKVLYITLFRIYILGGVVISIPCIFWLKSQSSCWETSFGQEIYRLIIFDSLLSIICVPIFEYSRSLIYRYLLPDIGIPEFDIAYNTLSLIYNQTLLWMGLFYSPLLAVVVTLKIAILFYMKYYSTLKNYKPPVRSWKTAQTQTVFLCLIFFSLLCIIFVLGYTFISVHTGSCGPLQNKDFMYLIFLEEILDLKEDNTFFAIIMYFTKPGILALFLIVLSVIVYYLRAKAIAEKSMVKQLRNMLILQTKDKRFLLNAIRNVSEGRWIYDHKPDHLSFGSPQNDFVSSPRTPQNAEFQFISKTHPRKASHPDNIDT